MTGAALVIIFVASWVNYRLDFLIYLFIIGCTWITTLKFKMSYAIYHMSKNYSSNITMIVI